MGFIYLFFLPVMLPSEIPSLATDPPVRVFAGVWKLLSFLRLPSQDVSPSLPLLSLFLSFIFFPTSFWRQWSAFLGTYVLCQNSEVVMWNLLSVQMFFQWICVGASGLPVLFNCYHMTAPQSFSLQIRPSGIKFYVILYLISCEFIMPLLHGL